MMEYLDNRNGIIQSVEIDLTEIPHKSRQDIKSKIAKYERIFEYKARGNKLVYKTEVLLPNPKVINKNRINLLMVFGNPAVHSVEEGMFFSYERTRTDGKWREHRFWRALRDCGVLEFNTETPTPKNIKKINDYKRKCLLNRKYESDFNIFLLPYFSFPTPASGKYNGVDGIKKIVGKQIFEEMKKFESQRFKRIILCNEIKNVICFQKSVFEEIKRTKNEQISVDYAGPTKLIHTKKGKERLGDILSDIKTKNRAT